MMKLVDKARFQGDILGGKVVVVKDVPAGLGSHTQWDLKLDGRLVQSLVSIQTVKAVGFGDGTKLAENFGSVSHYEIFYSNTKGFYRKTNKASGIEGGMSNGESCSCHLYDESNSFSCKSSSFRKSCYKKDC